MWTTLPPYGDGGGSQRGASPSTAVCELYVTAWDVLNYRGPEHSQPSTLRAGAVLGFNLEIYDYDHYDRGADAFYYPSSHMAGVDSSGLWLDAVLIAHPDAPHPSAVRSRAWAFIKRASQRPLEP